MTGKRKFCDVAYAAPRKRRVKPVNNPKHNPGRTQNENPLVSHELLSLYYPHVVSLRQFLLSRLPISATSHRRRVSTYGSDNQAHTPPPHFFDSTLVGVFSEPLRTAQDTRQREFVAFTQSQQKSSSSSSSSSNNGSTPGRGFGEIVEFAIWTLFHRAKFTSQRPNHLLCLGFQRDSAHYGQARTGTGSCAIPGLVARHPNESVRLLKQDPWTELSLLLGDKGIEILPSLLLDCGIFIPLETGMDNFYQLSGIPLSDLKVIDSSRPSSTTADVFPDPENLKQINELHKPAQIVFLRSRMLHAKPGLNGRGNVRFGLKHIHVFNRFPHPHNIGHVIHNMKYMFPRQFGLHNVFTSTVDSKETAQRFKDYTLREHEIARQQAIKSTGATSFVDELRPAKVPKRLRGGPKSLVRKMLQNHLRCSYTQLLRYYCPASIMWPGISVNSSSAQSQRSCASSTHLVTQAPATKTTTLISQPDPLTLVNQQSSMQIVGYATPAANVSAFCQSVMRKLLPRDALGVGASGSHNVSNYMACIDRFIRMRRFESLSLHEVIQGIKLACIPWLHSSKVADAAKMSQSDRKKRLEILLEFIYYLFDSILVPLIRSNFYVTESGVHRNQLFYFRHDIWRKISEPCLEVLRIRVYEELKPRPATRVLNSGSLGYSHVRLLPKSNAFRPIINLGRRATKNSGGVAVLGKSINKQLEPVFDILNYEKSQQSARLGSALFSIGELHDRLRTFKRGLAAPEKQQLYFVKVDVQTCFDTIPQAQLLRVLEDLLSSDSYEISKRAEIKPGDERWRSTARKPSRKFVGSAHPSGDPTTFSIAVANEMAQYKKRTVYSSTGNPKVWDTAQVLRLLKEHVQQNVVKIGKKYYRQKNGIPQGSVLSTLLCGFFYGHFEMQHLNFLVEGESLLVRLIDDFLLVTTNQNHARHFLQVMGDGSEEHGISVNTKKSLANFEMLLNQSKIPRLHGSNVFPYCGMLIDTRTLEISKDRARKDALVSNTLTVEYNRWPRQSFHRKVLMSLRIQMHALVLDTSLNAPELVAQALYQNFTETAMKMHRYLMSLPRRKRPSGKWVMEAIKDVAKLASNTTSGKRRTKVVSEWTCTIASRQIFWLAATAFEDVLRRKQTAYAEVLSWLRDGRMDCESQMKTNRKMKRMLMEGRRAVFRDCKF